MYAARSVCNVRTQCSMLSGVSSIMNLLLKSVCILIVVNVCGSTTENPTTQASVDYHTRHPAADNQFPYMVYIYMEFEGIEQIFLCGGVIVDENHILTSASCFVSEPTAEVEVDYIGITAGSNAQPNTVYTYRIINYDIKRRYNSTGYIHDLIMLKVSPSFVFSSQISPITAGDSWSDMFGVCVLPTWFDGMDWDYLHWYYIGQFDCGRTSSLLYCAGDPTQQTAVTTPDDVGGAMICNNKLVGLVTMNSDSQYFTNITEHYNWIQESLGRITTTTGATSTSPVLTTASETTVPGTSPPATSESTTKAGTTLPGTSSGTTEPTTGTGTTVQGTSPPATSESTTEAGTTLPGTSSGTAEPTTGIGTTVQGTSPPATSESTTEAGTILPGTSSGTAEPTTGTGTTVQGTSPPATSESTTETGTTLPGTSSETAEPTTGTGTTVQGTSPPATSESTTEAGTTLPGTSSGTAEPPTGTGTTVPPSTTTQGDRSAGPNIIIGWHILISAILLSL